jgi:hypothetical protein
VRSKSIEFGLLPRCQSFAKFPLKTCIKTLEDLKFFQGFFAVAGIKLSQAQRIMSLRAAGIQFYGSLQQSETLLSAA